MLSFKTSNDAIIRDFEPFLVSTPYNRPFMDLEPLGLRVPEANVIDPLRMSSEVFLHILYTLDGLTFGPEGMPMPKWVFYDGAELPGAIFGFARRAADLSPRAREVFKLPDGYDGLVPYSMFIAIPMLEGGVWMGHNLASMSPIFPEDKLSGLASMTKAFGLKVYRTRHLYGATQWRSDALYIHIKFGPLDLTTAFTPAHSEPYTLTYHFPVTDECLRAAAGDPTAALPKRAPTLMVDADDQAMLERLHEEIQAGARYQIVGKPARAGDKVHVPVARVE